MNLSNVLFLLQRPNLPAACEAHLAGMGEHGGAVGVNVLIAGRGA
jgi:hypothetical protein